MSDKKTKSFAPAIPTISMRRGTVINKNSPVVLQNLTKCLDCPIQLNCDKYMADGRCYFEIERLKAGTQKGKAISSMDQKKYLEDLEESFRKYEEAIKYDTKPNKKELLKLISMKMQLYELIHGKTPNMNTNILMTSSSTMDIKKIMEELRKGEKDNTVVVEGEVVTAPTDSPPLEEEKVE